MAFPPLSLSFSDASPTDSGIKGLSGPWLTGGGVWNVATGGSTAKNSGSVATDKREPGTAGVSNLIPYALGALALLVAFKVLR